MKVCAATSYTRDFAQIGNICAATLKIYSQKHGYSLRIIPDLVMQDRPPAWHRIRFIRELFDEGFDFVFWMDADALFLRYDRDILEVVEPGKDLYLVCHPVPDPLLGQRETPNTGVMLLRNCEWTKGFLEEIWNREQYRDHPWRENAALLDLLGYFNLLGKGANQPNKDLLGYIKFIGLEWNSFPHVAGCSAPHPMIHHYPRATRQYRIRKMTLDYLISSRFLPGELMKEKEMVARWFSRAKRMVWYAKSRFREWGWRRKMHQLDSIFHYIGMRDGFVVQQGPFAGMYYLSQAVHAHSASVPKLLGTYEAELYDVIAQFATKSYSIVVNVGCGEGYYAIGLARMLQHAHIYAFDIDQQCQEWCTEMARLNNVADRVTIAGPCNLEQLRALTTQPALLVVDCEGYELDLLQPDVLPSLCLCDILVEFHDFINPIISYTICERFAATHDITIINSKERDPVDSPALRSLSVHKQRFAVDEFRPVKMQWAFMRAKAAYQGNSKNTTIGHRGDEKELIVDDQEKVPFASRERVQP